MTVTVAPVQQDVYAVLQPFIASATGLDPSLVIQGLPNRISMPAASPGFIVMQDTRTERITTNVDDWDQVSSVDPTTSTMQQSVKLTVQLDCYGASSGDWAVILSTLLRDQYGCDALGPTCQPLYTDGPILAPLEDSEDQYEQRWTVLAYLAYTPIVTVSAEFADTLDIDVINVDERYPP